MSDQSSSQANEVAWKEIITKGLATGVVAGVAGAVFFGTNNVVIMGKSIPVVVPMALGAASGAVAADLVHKFAFPLIPHNAKYEKMEAATLSIAAAGLGTYAASSLFGPANLTNSLILGCGSFVASDFLWFNYMSSAESILF